MSAGLIIELAVILILLAASASTSGAEVAFFSLGPREREQLNQKHSKSAHRVLHLLVRPEDLLATLLVTNNLLNMGIVILSTWVTNETLTGLDSLPVLKFIIQVVIITFIILLIGEVLPKIYATRHAAGISQIMSLPVMTAERILRPVNRILIGSTSLVRRRLKDQGNPLTMDELSEALVLTGPELADEEKILKGIVRFGNIEVGEIMKPRVDMYCVDMSLPFRDAFDQMTAQGYSRFPVYHGSIDDIRGIIYLKDLLPHIRKSNSFRWQTLVRPAFFIPENKHINDLLQEFRLNRMHMAVVVDEYGGTSGLITLEDILEEIVGEIRDESDEEEILVTRLGENHFLCSGKISLNDLVRELGLGEDFFDQVKGGSETLAGLILEQKGEMPEQGETLRINGIGFLVKSRDDRRIREVEVRTA